MGEKILEVCVDSVESAIAAARGGAARLELCANLIIGGTTPSHALFDAVRSAVDLPIHVLIRPRFGDFLYTDAEYDIMCQEITFFAQRGAAAVVIGALHSDGTLDCEKMKGMIAAAKGCRVTLHRAFDVCADPMQTLEEAISLGVNTILTSGQKASAWQGRELIGQLIECAGDRMEILIGGGVSAQVITEFHREFPKAHAFHLSGKMVLDSGMQYRNEEVSMGLPGISEFQIWRTDENAIVSAVQALNQ
ncbi:MAG: copper homeostasis protein CutC [Oscillospiraceae bacterium]|nr:copper homeostasis protein CutC [Oscillospiraceae bacterium]